MLGDKGKKHDKLIAGVNIYNKNVIVLAKIVSCITVIYDTRKMCTVSTIVYIKSKY